ncbi:hypothetical protein PLEOSDRAFT_1108754 [Pleurotus ostreatus PC15]|uniref:MYND-type domain-containing protein n=1 Tax=Pleurotus ostreatus (strain PC15) TaxID=1137138 RepID=A0A067N5J4_PLEO1|nr:hypothetical protein PLEOSDRAFT_1108754 [Pleurotus ostreatus PC15]
MAGSLQTCAGCSKLPGGRNGTSSGSALCKDFKRCSGCKKVWYCGPECQKDDWVRHIFDCDTNQKITTAHHLALAVRDKSLPVDDATLVEYGFTRAPTAYAKSQLLGVYVDLVERYHVPTKRIHRWASEDVLLSNISETFERFAEESHGPHYPWLLENLSVLGTSTPVFELAPFVSSISSKDRRRQCYACGWVEGDASENRHTCGAHIFASYKQCSGCKKVWYCSEACQKSNWVRHIFECQPRQPINTSHHLALAACDKLIPADPQTRIDYGFTKVPTSEARLKLLGVYEVLIVYMNVPARKLHKWRNDGRLLPEIKAALEKLPGDHGAHYHWLLENQHILDGSVHEATRESTPSM